MVVENVDGPRRARPGHVIVRPEAVGICGSDFHLFSGDVAALSGASDFYPRVQGHEVAAVVADPGDSGHEEGDRVAIWPLLPCGRCYPCRTSRPNVCPAFRLVGVHLDGGLQERLEVPAEQVFSVGDLDPDCACFVEPASVAVHAVARGRLRAGEQVLVIGVGPIGLAVLAAARHEKARVMSVDPVKGRRAPVRPGIFPEKEIDVLGSSAATAADFRYAISLVTSARENISKLFSHHFPLARAAEAFEFAMSRPPDAVKIVVNVN
jgi:L-gulonate 5-dehydrogenase